MPKISELTATTPGASSDQLVGLKGGNVDALFNISDVVSYAAAGTLPNSGVTAGSYTNTNLTINAKGLITAAANGIGGPVVRTQRSITASGNLPIVVGDSILNINAATDLAPAVPAYATRVGLPLTFKNLPGSHLQTLTRTGGDTFDGATTYSLAPGAAVTLMPYNDGTNTGYAIQ